MNKKFIAFIPARKGSQGIKDKNLIKIGTKKLVEYTFKEVNKIKGISCFVATDDQRVKNIAKKYNINCEYQRPKKVSNSQTPMIETLYDFNKKFKKKIDYDYVIILQPTSPLRSKKDIQKAIQEVNKKKLLSLTSISKSIEHPYESIFFKNKRYKPFFSGLKNFSCRQDFDKRSFFINGAIGIIHKTLIEKKKTEHKIRHGFVLMKKINSLDLNDVEELEIIKKILKR